MPNGAEAANGQAGQPPPPDGDADVLARIADALERLAPPNHGRARSDAADAFVWHPDGRLAPVPHVNRVDMALLKGIDRVRDIADREYRALRPWPAGQQRAVVGRARHGQVIAGEGRPRGLQCRPRAAAEPVALKLIEIHREDIESLPALMALTRAAPFRFIVFCDDLSFDNDDTATSR